ncbi:Mitochondrial carrier [Gracilaria domingensis]|nr:Mitochondrial carrier [Gracilaria domingensis]
MDRSRTGKDAQAPDTVPYASLKTFLVGAVSGAVAKTAVAPLDRTRKHALCQRLRLCRVGAELHNKDPDANLSNVRLAGLSRGFYGFFRGNSATIARIMPYAAVQYSSFEFYHRTLSDYVFHSDAPNPLKRFMAGAMAGSTSVLCTYPFDLARTVLAVRVAHASPAQPVRNPGIAMTLHSILREEGVTGIYRGMYPTLAGVVPYAGTSFLTYGVLRRAADRRGVSELYPITTSLVCGGTAGLGELISFFRTRACKKGTATVPL